MLEGGRGEVGMRKRKVWKRVEERRDHGRGEGHTAVLC